MSKVIHVRNPRVLLVDDVAGLIKRAVDSVELIAPNGIDATAQEFYNYTTEPNMFMFIGMQAGNAKAMLLGHFPTSHLFPYPMITLIYNEGDRSLIQQIKEEAFKLVASKGYSKAWAINTTGRSHKVWKRAMTPKNGKITDVGMAVEIALI